MNSLTENVNQFQHFYNKSCKISPTNSAETRLSVCDYSNTKPIADRACGKIYSLNNPTIPCGFVVSTKHYSSLREYILSVCDRLVESYYETLTDFEKTIVCRVAYNYNGRATPKELTVIKALAHRYLGGF